MKIVVKTSHVLVFTIEAFWHEEGGMGHEVFGTPQNTLEDAVYQLELAKAFETLDTDWVIVVKVKTKVNKDKGVIK